MSLCVVLGFSFEVEPTFLTVQMFCEQRSIAKLNAAILYMADFVMRCIAMLLKTQSYIQNVKAGYRRSFGFQGDLFNLFFLGLGLVSPDVVAD